MLKNTECWSKEEFENYQNRCLRRIVEYAYRYVPFYHELYKRNNISFYDIRTKNDLHKLPIIEKEDIRNNDKIFSVRSEAYTTRHTSGTTGKPLHLRISKDAYLLDMAAAYHGRRYVWSKYDGGWVVRLVGDNPVKDCNAKILYRNSYITKRMIFPSYCLSFKNIKKIIEEMKKNKIKYLQAYPSTAYLIAKYLEITDQFYPLNALFYSSEPLYTHQRKIIEERFDTKLFGFYGQAETAISAVECEEAEYHLTMIDGILEITRNGEVLDYGEKGFAVVTSLHNQAMPLIRYKLDDYTGYYNEPKCSRKIPLIFPVETKAEDFIVTPDGRLISPSLLTFPFKELNGVIESQIIQRSLYRIDLNIIKNNDFNYIEEKRLINSFKEILGSEFEIKINFVKKIEKTSAYKQRFVINELGTDFFEKLYYVSE